MENLAGNVELVGATNTHEEALERMVISKSSEDGALTIFVRKATFQDIPIMKSEIMSSHSSKVNLDFLDCDLITARYLKQMREGLNSEIEITSLEISYVDNIDEIINEIFLIVGKYRTKSLSLEYDGMNDETVERIRYLSHDEKINSNLEKLDISYNKEISPVGYVQIGKLIRKSKIASFIATACNITDETLLYFFAGLKDTKLKELDISCNAKLTEEGFESLAKFIVRNKIGRLRLSSCELSNETIIRFHKVLSVPRRNLLLDELDMSYNPWVCNFDFLGGVVVNYGISKLSLAGCKLNGEKLRSLRESISDHKMHTLNIRDNPLVGDGLSELARLVSQCRLEELDISDCIISPCQLQYFTKYLNGTELSRLRLGDRECEPSDEYIEEVCRLLKNVDVLFLRFHKLKEDLFLLLQKTSRNSSTKIFLFLGSDKKWVQKDIA